MTATKPLIYLIIFLNIFSCSDRSPQKKIIEASPKEGKIHVDNTSPIKPTINVFIENSGSMDGYVKGVTEFEQAVYGYLSDISISNITDTLNLYYINPNRSLANFSNGRH